jgi:N-methylhydantoinase A
MPTPAHPQTRIGVDVGGTFTDLVSVDESGTLRIIKVPSTPPHFEQGVLTAIQSAIRNPQSEISLTHGSTVATNALLQRTGDPVAFLTTEGFRDLLLIGRQNRPHLYALQVQRPTPIIPETRCFTVHERISAKGEVVTPLNDAEVDQVLNHILSQNIHHLAVCLLFSFINPTHERRIAAACQKKGISCSLSSQILPEFREYERASTTAINAALRPTVERYLTNLDASLSSIRNPQSEIRNLSIMQSNGGTLKVAEAIETPARLVLSGPAGGVIGASFIAQQLGHQNIITYDMGGTSTDVATLLNSSPSLTTSTVIDGLPLSLPMFDIHTVGAGGGSVAYLDAGGAGGALRVGPRSAGSLPGPACYDRGGSEPTVTDANLLLGRILPSHFLGGAMQVRRDLAEAAVGRLARQLGKSLTDTALGILRVVESNMEHAVRAVTTRRGHDPRDFTLVSFGGAGGLHACSLAASLDIPRVLIPPHCGVLSALGMTVAPPVADASKTVLHLNIHHDDSHLPAEFGYLSGLTADAIPPHLTSKVEPLADVRLTGQSHELTVPLQSPTLENIDQNFRAAYQQRYGTTPPNRPIQITTLRIRRTGIRPPLTLPPLNPDGAFRTTTPVTLQDGTTQNIPALNRPALLQQPTTNQQPTTPFLLIDPDATTFIPPNWTATIDPTGSVLLSRGKTRVLSEISA